MKPLRVAVALACIAHMPAQAWTYAAPPASGWLADSRTGNARLWSVAAPQPIAITPASVVVQLPQATIFIDPVGPQEQYGRFGRPDIVILTRAHPDHLSVETMIGMLRRDTIVLAPQSVIDQLPLMISNNVISPFEAGTSQVVEGIRFRALSAASTIPPGLRVFARDRGDIGVILEIDGASLYF